MSLITPEGELADLMINHWTLDKHSRTSVLKSSLPASLRLSIAKRMVALNKVNSRNTALRNAGALLLFLTGLLILNIDGGFFPFPSGRLAIVTAITLFCIGLLLSVTWYIFSEMYQKRYRNLLVELEEPKS